MDELGGFPRAVRRLGGDWVIHVTATVPGVDHLECVPGWRVQLVDEQGCILKESVEEAESRAMLKAELFARSADPFRRRRPSS